MRRGVWLLKQTLYPPRNTIPVSLNPLTRWSRQLPRWSQLAGALTPVRVGLEGCHSAFNATNSIRTCLYFQTISPPTFLTAFSWKSLEHIQIRDSPPPSTEEESATRTLCAAESSRTNCEEVEEGWRDTCTGTLIHPFDGLAFFGEDRFFSRPRTAEEIDFAAYDATCPIIALENFADRAQSIMRTRLVAPGLGTDGIKLVVGHENWGVRRSLLQEKDGESCANDEGDAKLDICPPPTATQVVYIPQYGTISSLNVVTSLGIALFYCYLDATLPGSRHIHRPHCVPPKEASRREHHQQEGCDSMALEKILARIRGYQAFFSQALPQPSNPTDTTSATKRGQIHDSETYPTRRVATTALQSVDSHRNTTPRIDRRPLHPVFFLHEPDDIARAQREYRQALLQYSRGCSRHTETPSEDSPQIPSTPALFGLSVLYENEYDQRNFGGLIRNANAFLVDHIFYVGRRKVNVVGAVGSHRYTPPIYLGGLPTVPTSGVSDDSADSKEWKWSTEVKAKVEERYGGISPVSWWLLDCGHASLYGDSIDPPAASNGKLDGGASRSEPSSLRLYSQLKADGCLKSLCDTEVNLRNTFKGGLVLIVPQEGKLPHPALMRLCTGILIVLPDNVHCAAKASEGGTKNTEGHRGLPSQVASGIALQRLSAVMHPFLAAV